MVTFNIMAAIVAHVFQQHVTFSSCPAVDEISTIMRDATPHGVVRVDHGRAVSAVTAIATRWHIFGTVRLPHPENMASNPVAAADSPGSRKDMQVDPLHNDLNTSFIMAQYWRWTREKVS